MKNHKTICLSLVVKNQDSSIKACLESVRGLIDQWVIVDCESTDGTIGKIYDALQGIPGQIYGGSGDEWCELRNKALGIAKKKADYVLILDPDETLVYEKGFHWPCLHQDDYSIEVLSSSGAKYTRECLLSAERNWVWEGKLHQTLICKDAKQESRLLKGISKGSKRDDEASSQESLARFKEFQILQQKLATRPDDPEILFVVALNAIGMGDDALALSCFEKRIPLGGEKEQVYISIYEMGRLLQKAGAPRSIYIRNFYAAYELMPERPEALYALAACHRSSWNPQFAALLFEAMMQQRPPSSIRYENNHPSSFQLQMELAGHYRDLGKIKEALMQLMQLSQHDLSCASRTQVQERIKSWKAEFLSDPLYEEIQPLLSELEAQEFKLSPEQKTDPHRIFKEAWELFNKKDLPHAIAQFQKRLTLKGSLEEICLSLYALGRSQEALRMPAESYLRNYHLSYESIPVRAESLDAIAKHHLKQDRIHFAYLLQKAAVQIPKPVSGYLLDAFYDYELPMRFAEVCQRVDRQDEALAILRYLRGMSLSAAVSQEIDQRIQVLGVSTK